MASPISARRHGDDFQARLFWLNAASLLDPLSPVIKVAYETGPKSFDDILVEYDSGRAPQDHEGKPILRRHIQCKWHTTAGVFGFADLADPAFVGAQRFSFLQKAHLAQTQHAPDGTGCRFELVTNWRLKPDDPLLELVRKESDALNLGRLFEGTTDRGRMGEVRKLWCEHLDIDRTDLHLVARTLAIAETTESLANLRGRLDDRFAAVGMKRIPAHETAFPYDDLAIKLLAQGRVEFDRDGFHNMLDKEGLLDGQAKPAEVPAIGVRSFLHPIDPLEERCSRMLNLVPYFDGRYIRDEADWNGKVLPELQRFVIDEARSRDHLRVVLDAHVSLAFAVGAQLNVKSGKRVDIEQRSEGRRFWSSDDIPADSTWSRFEFREEVRDHGASGVGLAISLTHDVSAGVLAFTKVPGSSVGQVLHCRPEGGPSQHAIRCGRHAWMLAESVVQEVRSLQRSATEPLHVFIAGPNAFAFFLGQHRQALGPVVVYEWDFDGQRGGGYSPGLAL